MTTSTPLNSSACYTLLADADPSVLSRVVEHFVVLDILPDTLKLRRYIDGAVEISVKVRGLDEARLDLVARKLRQIVTVRQVGLEIFSVGGDIAEYRNLHRTAVEFS